MAYVTQTELEQRDARLKAWTDDDASGAVDAAIVTEAIDNASAEIDAAAGQQYQTPLGLSDATTARIVKDRTGAIAVYKIASRVGGVDENVRLQYEDALAWLNRLRDGRVALAGETLIAADKPGGGIVLGGSKVIVDRDSMDGL